MKVICEFTNEENDFVILEVIRTPNGVQINAHGGNSNVQHWTVKEANALADMIKMLPE